MAYYSSFSGLGLEIGFSARAPGSVTNLASGVSSAAAGAASTVSSAVQTATQTASDAAAALQRGASFSVPIVSPTISVPGGQVTLFPSSPSDAAPGQPSQAGLRAGIAVKPAFVSLFSKDAEFAKGAPSMAVPTSTPTGAPTKVRAAAVPSEEEPSTFKQALPWLVGAVVLGGAGFFVLRKLSK